MVASWVNQGVTEESAGVSSTCRLRFVFPPETLRGKVRPATPRWLTRAFRIVKEPGYTIPPSSSGMHCDLRDGGKRGQSPLDLARPRTVRLEGDHDAGLEQSPVIAAQPAVLAGD